MEMEQVPLSPTQPSRVRHHGSWVPKSQRDGGLVDVGFGEQKVESFSS